MITSISSFNTQQIHLTNSVILYVYYIYNIQSSKLHITRSQHMELLLLNLIQHMSSIPQLINHAKQATMSLKEILEKKDQQENERSGGRDYTNKENTSQYEENESVYSSRSSHDDHEKDDDESILGKEVFDNVRIFDDMTQDAMNLLKIEISTLKVRLSDELDRNVSLENEKNNLLKQLWSRNSHCPSPLGEYVGIDN